MSNAMDEQGSPKRFAYEWTTFNKINPLHFNQFIGWISVLEKPNFNGMYLIDAGCGIGRNSYWMHKLGARKILAFDVEENTVEVAKKNIGELPGVSVQKLSIYEPKLPDAELADIAFSIGVIHHLADPVSALKNLSNLVKVGGKVVIWVYGREGNGLLLWLLKPLRLVTPKIPMPLLNILSDLFTLPLYISLRIPLYQSPYLKLISKFKYNHLKSIVLDQLLPKIAHYWTREQAIKILSDAGLGDVKAVPVHGMSFSLSGVVNKN